MHRHPLSSSRFAVFPVLLTALALFEACVAGADAPPAVPKKGFPELLWRVDDGVPKALMVFPSPVDPDVVFISSAEGLWRTRTNGADWERIPKTSPAEIGTVSCLTVCPTCPEFVVLGTDERGAWLSHDGGATWRKGGGPAEGLSSEHVESVAFSSEDRAWETLLVCHGTTGAGISKSLDGGRHWRVMDPTRYFRSVVSMGQYLAGASATIHEPDNWQVVRSRHYGETWNLIRRGVLPTEVARGSVGPDRILWGIRGGRLLLSEDDGESYAAVAAAPEGRWHSVFVTPGPDPREEWFWVYDPFRHGLLGARNAQETWTPRNWGLYVDRVIRTRANAAANAAGTRFYACINDLLYVAEPVAELDSPVILQAGTEPPVLVLAPAAAVERHRRQIFESCVAINKFTPLDVEIPGILRMVAMVKRLRAGRRFGVRVRVDHPGGRGAVRSVSVTPDLFGLGPVPLFDDGKHDDGEAADGLWGGEFTFEEGRMRGAADLADDGRRPFPGSRGIPVTAVDAEGNTASWTLVVRVFYAAEPFVFWHGGPNGERLFKPDSFTEGDVTVGVKEKGEAQERPVLEVKGGKGPWRAYRAADGSDIDATGLRYVVVRFRGSPGAADVAFFLVDQMTHEVRSGGREASEPKSLTTAVPLLKNRYLPAMDGRWHLVKIPMLDLVGDVRFMRRHLAGFGLEAAEGAAGGTYHIDEVRFTDE